MDEPIFETKTDLMYTLGDMYPKATKFFIAERLRYYDCWDINLDLNYDTLEDLCTDRDWFEYCRGLYDHEWLEEYMAEWGTIPIKGVECKASGFIKNYTLYNYAPTGTVKYTATQCMDDVSLLIACHSADLIKMCTRRKLDFQ